MEAPLDDFFIQGRLRDIALGSSREQKPVIILRAESVSEIWRALHRANGNPDGPISRQGSDH
jgi:hypothetical protein